MLNTQMLRDDCTPMRHSKHNKRGDTNPATPQIHQLNTDGTHISPWCGDLDGIYKAKVVEANQHVPLHVI